MIERKGLNPTTVLTCATAAAILIGLFYSLGFTKLAAILGNGFCVVAYLIALVSCWRVAATYPGNSFIRWGWLAMCGNCIFSILRHLVLNEGFWGIFGTGGRVYFLSQAFQLPALLLVLTGMLSIWWGVFRLGLGFRLRRLDWAAVALVAAFVTWISRNNLSLAGQGATFVLQAINLALLIGIGGVGLLLHALSMQMGGGRLAVVMRCFAVYALTRSLLTVSQLNRDHFALAWWECFYAVPWIFAFAASYSSWLADTVKRSIRNRSFKVLV